MKHEVVQTFTCDRGAISPQRKMWLYKTTNGAPPGLLGLVEHDPGGELHDDLVRVGVWLLLLLLETLDPLLDGDTHPRITI